LTTLSLILGFLVLGVIGFAARPSRAAPRSRVLRAVGCFLILVPLPLAVAVQLDAVAFVAGTVAFAVGGLLVLPWPDDEGRGEPGADEPPWWPDFDQKFRAYAGRSSAGPGRVRGSKP
jgi:hypothetical protein